MATPLTLVWRESSDTSEHQAVIEQTMRLFVNLGSNLHTKHIGEYLSIQKLDRLNIGTDVVEFAPWTLFSPSLMRAEWALYDDDQIIVLQKYFTSALNGWWYNNSEYQDFYRLVGDGWSICFRLNQTRSQYGPHSNTEYSRMYGATWSNITVECLTCGDIEQYSNDIALLNLMGNCTLME